MDWSKIEALKYKEAAEKKIICKDFVQARNMLNKALQLFPGLENASQMSAVCDILSASEMVVPGCGIDWYWVLRLAPTDGDEAIKSQHQKLSSYLESIKDKFPGTEPAFKLIREAFSVLMDQAKRLEFDSRRNVSRNGVDNLNSDTHIIRETKSAEAFAMDNGRTKQSPSSAKRLPDIISMESNGTQVLNESPSKRPREFAMDNEVVDSAGLQQSEPNGKKEKIVIQEITFANEPKMVPGLRCRENGGAQTSTDVSWAVPDNLVVQGRNATMGSMEMTNQSTDRTKTAQAPPLSTVTMLNVNKGSNPDIQYYKRNWSARDFVEDQIWAIFDGLDEMPRVYVKVNNVSSPDKVSVVYLEPHPMHVEEIGWVEENLPFVCGIFRASRACVDLEMSKFCNLMKCERSARKSYYKIYPNEGEIWCIYQKWHSKWKLSDHKNYQIQVVEILSDFSEEIGCSVASLVQVNGCVAFYERQSFEGFDLTRTIPRAEMLSFSHRIPAYTVLGIEAYGIPKTSWHLEPDALPLKLLK